MNSQEETIIEQSKTPSDRVVLDIQNLTKRFGKLTAINNVSFKVFEGEVLGIIGPNGSGKTTLFNLISARLKPDNGKIYAENGDNIIGKSTTKIVRKYGIARTFQIVRPFKLLNSLENLTVPHVPRKLFSKPSNLKSAAMSSLLEVDLGEKKNYPALILPHGDLKRLDFARALATGPKIILLDEPFSGLSSEDAFRITHLINNAKEHGVTIMIVEHKLKELAKLVDRIIVLDHGVLLAKGTPQEMSQNKEVIASYLGKEASNIVRS